MIPGASPVANDVDHRRDPRVPQPDHQSVHPIARWADRLVTAAPPPQEPWVSGQTRTAHHSRRTDALRILRLLAAQTRLGDRLGERFEHPGVMRYRQIDDRQVQALGPQCDRVLDDAPGTAVGGQPDVR